MNSHILSAKDLDIENILFTVPKINKNTKQLSALIKNAKTNSTLLIETPYCITPFGASPYDGGSKGLADEAKSWSISLKAQGYQTQDDENKEMITKFFEFAKALDEKAIDYGITNSQTIFSKKYDESQRGIVADALYTRLIKPSAIDPNTGNPWPDKISLKISKKDQLPDVMIFKDSPEPITLDSWDTLKNIITKGSSLKAIIEVKLYFLNKKFGINIKVLQIKLVSIDRPGRPVGYAFSESLPIKNSESLPIKNSESNIVKKSDETETIVADSDEEEIEYEDQDN
jgi:hypothetical protein